LYRRLHKKLTTEAKKSYYKELFDSGINSVKQLWNNLNHMVSLGKKKGSNLIPKLLLNNIYIEDTKQISDYFNIYFCTIGVNLQHTLKQCNADDFKAYLPNSVKDSMYCAPVTKDEILKIITKLKNNKSPGPECLTPKITKICCWCDN